MRSGAPGSRPGHQQHHSPSRPCNAQVVTLHKQLEAPRHRSHAEVRPLTLHGPSEGSRQKLECSQGHQNWPPRKIEGRHNTLFAVGVQPANVGVISGRGSHQALSLRSTSCFSSHLNSLTAESSTSVATPFKLSVSLFLAGPIEVSLSFLDAAQQNLRDTTFLLSSTVGASWPLLCLADSALTMFLWCDSRISSRPCATKLEWSHP